MSELITVIGDTRELLKWLNKNASSVSWERRARRRQKARLLVWRRNTALTTAKRNKKQTPEEKGKLDFLKSIPTSQLKGSGRHQQFLGAHCRSPGAGEEQRAVRPQEGGRGKNSVKASLMKGREGKTEGREREKRREKPSSLNKHTTCKWRWKTRQFGNTGLHPLHGSQIVLSNTLP